MKKNQNLAVPPIGYFTLEIIQHQFISSANRN